MACDGLTVRYGDTVAVDGLDLAAAAGEVLALLGPNGAGKTSTVEALTGYRRPATGRLTVLGHDPLADHRHLVRRVGVMLQRPGLYPMLSPRRALRLFASYYDRPAEPEALLDRVQLGPVATTPWRHLSGGEQQRLSLALALVGRPEVVFLDEPTAGVDPEGRLGIRSLVAGLAGDGVCVVLTTHELGEAEQLADRVVIIHRGRAVASGSPAELAAGSPPGVRFGARTGLDVADLAATLGAPVAEERPGRYLVGAAGSPALTAALAAWLAGHDAELTDLRTGRTLEEAYLEIVGAAGLESDEVRPADRAGRPRRRSGSRTGRGPA